MSKPNYFCPGPWHAEGGRVFTSYGQVVARTASMKECHSTIKAAFITEQANACLIAAAPELLRLLEQTLEIPEAWMDRETLSRAVEVCRKARGET